MSQQDFEGSTSSASAEWGTPDDLYQPLDEEFHFEFDLAATAENTKVPGHFFSKEDNALLKDWPRVPCWLNPPYSRSVWRWIKKAAEEKEKGTLTVILIKSETSSKRWFHSWARRHATDIRFIGDRVKHLKDGVQSDGAYFPSLLLVFQPGVPVPERRTGSSGPYNWVAF